MRRWHFRLALALSFLAAATVLAGNPYPLKSRFFPQPIPAASGAFGSSVAADGNYVVVGGYLSTYDTGLGACGSAAVYDATTGALLLVLDVPDRHVTDYFGYTVAISGNYAVVAALLRQPAGAPLNVYGEVFVYDLSSPIPGEPVLVLNALNLLGAFSFGRSLALDGSRLAVGSPGRVDIYNLTGDNPSSPVVTLRHPRQATDLDFGPTVALSGNTLAIRSSKDDEETNNGGLIYIYDLGGPNPTTPVARLTNPTAADSTSFGASLAITGTRIVVAAGLPDISASEVAAYVYDLSSPTPDSPVTSLRSSSPTRTSLPFSVAAHGNQVLVGAQQYDSADTFAAGIAFLYQLDGSISLDPVMVLPNPSPYQFGHFGASVAITEQVIAIGTPSAGTASLYRLDGSSPIKPTATLTNPFVSAYDWFGYAIATTDRFLVVGSPRDDTGTVDAGAVYVFDRLNATPDVARWVIHSPGGDGEGGRTGRSFGKAVAISGEHMAIAEQPYPEASATVYIYHLGNANPAEPLGQITAEGFSRLVSIAISEGKLIVGGYDSSPAFVYDLTSQTPTIPFLALSAPAGSSPERTVVAIDHNRIAVGDAYANGGPGRVCLYDLDSADPRYPVAALNNPNPQWSHFGWSVGISDSLLAIGSYEPDSLSPSNHRAIYIYDAKSEHPETPLIVGRPENSGFSLAVSGRRVVAGSHPPSHVSEDGPIVYSTWYAEVYDIFEDGSHSLTTLDLPEGDPLGFGYSVASSPHFVAVGGYGDNTYNESEGAAFLFRATDTSNPEINVQDPDGTWLSSGIGQVDFGSVRTGNSITRSFFISNTGFADLIGINITIDGKNANEFAVTSSPAETVAPGASTSFELTFTARTAAFKNIVLHVLSNDPSHNPFDIPVQARSLTELEAWRDYYFGDPDGLDLGADNADPDGDGNDNFFEFIAGLDPTDSGSRFVLQIRASPNQPNQKEIGFGPVVPRREYMVEAKSKVNSEAWEALTNFTFIDQGDLRTVTDLSNNGESKLYRIQITWP